MSDDIQEQCLYRVKCGYWESGSGKHPKGCYQCAHMKPSDKICQEVYETGFKAGYLKSKEESK